MSANGPRLNPFSPVDIERDIERATRDRERRVAEGLEPSREQLRATGGIVISDRASVLLERCISAHLKAAVTNAPEFHADRQTMARLVVEYIGALEAVIFDEFSREPGDTPRNWLGLSAATLEGVAGTYERAIEQYPEIAEGLAAIRECSRRLRILEERIGRIPGEPMTEGVHLIAPAAPEAPPA